MVRFFLLSYKIHLDNIRDVFIGTFINKAVRARTKYRKISRVSLIREFTFDGFKFQVAVAAGSLAGRVYWSRVIAGIRNGGYRGHHVGRTRVRPQEMSSYRRTTALSIGATGNSQSLSFSRPHLFSLRRSSYISRFTANVKSPSAATIS